MDIDKLIRLEIINASRGSFSSLMDIDKLIRGYCGGVFCHGFSSLMDIDKLIQNRISSCVAVVLVH